jgi:hypothetical protein
MCRVSTNIEPLGVRREEFKRYGMVLRPEGTGGFQPRVEWREDKDCLRGLLPGAEGGVAKLIVRFRRKYRWVEAGLWPEGPGKHSPGFTLGFGFIA